MRRYSFHAFVTALLGAALLGCGGASTSLPKTGPTSTASDASAHSHSHDATIADDVLAALPEEDRAPVKLQKICPVSGEPLGSMGAPIKVITDAGTAYMCCAGCEDEFRRDPKQHLAKLPAPSAP